MPTANTKCDVTKHRAAHTSHTAPRVDTNGR